MSSQKHNWDSEWRGLEPEQPKSGRCGCWLGLLALTLLLVSTCGAVGYFAWQQLGIPLQPSDLLARPTIPPLSSPAPFVSDAIEPPQNSPATAVPVIAPTVTLPGAATTAPDDAVARQMTIPPIIEGNLNEYADFPISESQYRVFNTETWDRSDDVRAFWRLGWDTENLYVAVQVEDDRHVQTQTDNEIFRGDGVSIQFDTERTQDFGPQLSPDDYQINLSPGDFAAIPPSAYRFRGNSGGDAVDFRGHTVQIAAVKTDNGYNIEAAIPWRDLGVTPQGGLLLGIALNVNDNDTPNTAVQEVMKSHVASRIFSDPSSWGTLTLR